MTGNPLLASALLAAGHHSDPHDLAVGYTAILTGLGLTVYSAIRRRRSGSSKER